MEALASAPTPSVEVRAAAAGRMATIGLGAAVCELSEGLFAFRLNAPAKSIVTLNFADSSSEATLVRVGGDYEVEIEGRRLHAVPNQGAVQISGESYRAADVGEDHVVVFEKGAAFEFSLLKWGDGAEADESDGTVRSPMPGRIVSIAKRAGESIKTGETLLVLEAMKMEHALKAPITGVIAELIVGEGAQVNEGVVLARIEA